MKSWNTCKKQNQKNPKWFFCSSCMTFISQYHWHFTFNGAPMSLSLRNWNLFSQFPMYHCLKNQTKKQLLRKYTVNTEPEAKSHQIGLIAWPSFHYLDKSLQIVSLHLILQTYWSFISQWNERVLPWRCVFIARLLLWQTAVLCSCWQQRDSRGSCAVLFDWHWVKDHCQQAEKK